MGNWSSLKPIDSDRVDHKFIIFRRISACETLGFVCATVRRIRRILREGWVLVNRDLVNECPLPTEHGKRSTFERLSAHYGVNLNVRSEWTESCTVDAGE